MTRDNRIRFGFIFLVLQFAIAVVQGYLSGIFRSSRGIFLIQLHPREANKMSHVLYEIRTFIVVSGKRYFVVRTLFCRQGLNKQ